MPDPEDYPLLSAIGSPADLRRLDLEQLVQLCTEIRRFLVEVLAVHPGHFASSMGAVELTVALHYVFDTPHDRIVWDVGHQAYVHKLLTGRWRNFHTLRQLGGVSPFPNPAESPYDTFTAGHASNSISAALGMAVAAGLKGDGRHAVAVIGDAAIGGGLAFEALNNAANAQSNLLIILNDNDMSIDRNTGSLNSYLAHITTSKAYNTLRYRAYRALKRMRLIKERQRGAVLRFNNSLKSLLTHEQNIFEGLNIRYFGPFDGHDLQRMIRVLRDIKEMKGPRLLHLRTVKGKGYAPAEADPSTWHAPGRFDPVTGERAAAGAPAKPKWQDVFGDELVRLAGADPRIVGITAAMPSGTSMLRLQEAYPQRAFDVGISEGHAVTFAGGLAKEGMRPWVAIYSSFLQRGYDQIIHDVALQGLPVTFCIDRAGLVGEDGATHHGVYDIAYLRGIPGLTLASPRSDEHLRALMRLAAQAEAPFAIRYPRGTAATLPPGCEAAPLAIGRGEMLRNGSQAVVLSLGPLCSEAAKAIDMLQAEGLSIAHYDMIFAAPLDADIISRVGRSGLPVVTVEDGTVAGGFGSAVMEALQAGGHTNRVERVGIPAGEFVPHGSPSQLYALCGMDAAAIANRIKQILT